MWVFLLHTTYCQNVIHYFTNCISEAEEEVKRIKLSVMKTEDEKQAQNELAIRGAFSGDSAVTALFRFPLFMRCIALECDPSFEVLK